MAGALPDSQGVEHFRVVRDLADFDVRSGNWLERVIFNNRLKLLALFAFISVFLGWQSMQIEVNANFERMIPSSHTYIRNFLDNKEHVRGLGNQIRIAVENTQGDIFDPEYLKVLAEINDILYLTPGVDRPWLKSLWTPLLRWSEVTEEGMRGGPVMPDGFDGSPAKTKELRRNLSHSGAIGNLVSTNMRSSMILVPLLDRYPDTGKPINYLSLSRTLEEKIRSKETDKIRIHIVGFGKLAGDLIEGLTVVISYFALSVLIAGVLVFLYTRCLRSTLVLVSSAILGVVWLIGLMKLLGLELDPYSILVPFLLFAIGLSHGAQKMNGILQDVGRGTHKYVAARYTFRRLFLAGLTALLTNIVGFLVLIIIEIPVIRDLALMTSVGVTGLIFTKLVLIPVILSYTGVSPVAARRAVQEQHVEDASRTVVGRLWAMLEQLTRRRAALAAVSLSVLLLAAGLVMRVDLQVGDLDAGAPELRPDSRYNLDVAYVTDNFGLTSDQFAVLVKTPPAKCDAYQALVDSDRLAWELEHVEGVMAVSSFSERLRRIVGGMSEGYYKLATIPRDDRIRGYAANRVISDNPDSMNPSCEVMPLVAYLTDHKAETLERVLKTVEAFAATHNRDDVQFLPAAGAAGIESVTNIVVWESFYRMHLLLYAAVVVLCFVTFRSWRAVVVAIVPLLLTSILCEAIMVALGIGVKVATLPVIALGVGVGVDYALYLLSIQLALQRGGASLAEAYKGSLDFTGKVVALVGATMAAGVVSWAWSPIKFQADMGILLTFMFLWNMIGALLLIPALSHFLLRDIGRRPKDLEVREWLPQVSIEGTAGEPATEKPSLEVHSHAV
ncbi:efflux RND transporter permease subunit [Aromatoleum petrolei]|uniref:MMPL family transporter n=1 Tax=Aromatoleum petrolei TaxID=76116 RepID=A0ABX1MKQ5_9RHOO|nr:MMPL family transporter [Aromatoleum petrolei]NMF88549.1 MMPL family transporter [Aromatoleum petrolei]QTQ34743.1 MMPL membrane transport protein domain-containing protein [Aromatoleum petrolei]